MEISLLFFIVGLFVGVVAVHIYFKKKIKSRDDSNLTIEAIIHEIRTPLTGINWIFNSLSEIKLGDVVNEETFDLIKEGKNKVGNAIGLANDAMSAMNTSVEHAVYKFEVRSISEVINKVVEENSLGAKEKSISVNVQIAVEVLPFFFDEIKMMLAIRNLVSNAIKYTSVGGRISIEARKEGKQVVIVVSDTGIGIPSVDMAKISNKFFRAKNIGDTSGTGLGLFIVRNIVAGHSGRIDIQSSEGKGTKVTIFLPIK